MRRLASSLIALLLAALLLSACGGNDQPSGPPPLTSAPSDTPAGPTPGTTLLTYRLVNGASGIAWAPDGKRLAIATGNHQGALIQVWDTTTNTQLLSFGPPLASDDGLAWSPDGKRIAVAGSVYAGGDNAGLRIWDASTGAALIAIVTLGQNGGSAVSTLAWSPDGSRIAGTVEIAPFPSISNPNPVPNYGVQIWDAASGKLLLTYSGHSDQVKALAWSPDSKLIASASNDQTVQVWEAASGKTRLTYRGHKQIVDAVAWSPDGNYLASGGGDNTVQVWEATTGTLRYTYSGHTSEVMVVAWSPDSKRVASASFGATEDHPIQVWDALTGHHVLDYRGLTAGAPVYLAWSSDGARIATAIGSVVTVWLAG